MREFINQAVPTLFPFVLTAVGVVLWLIGHAIQTWFVALWERTK